MNNKYIYRFYDNKLFNISNLSKKHNLSRKKILEMLDTTHHFTKSCLYEIYKSKVYADTDFDTFPSAYEMLNLIIYD